jgi:hypothetical protein
MKKLYVYKYHLGTANLFGEDGYAPHVFINMCDTEEVDVLMKYSAALSDSWVFATDKMIKNQPEWISYVPRRQWINSAWPPYRTARRLEQMEKMRRTRGAS